MWVFGRIGGRKLLDKNRYLCGGLKQGSHWWAVQIYFFSGGLGGRKIKETRALISLLDQNKSYL
jgi:hypothetical protein